MLALLLANKALIITGLYALCSEVLGLIPSVKSNSVFQLVLAGLKQLKDLMLPKS